MKIMDSMPQLENERAVADKEHQTETPSPAFTQSLMALDSKTNLDQLTTSITNTLARIDLPTTQCPAQQTDKETINNSLPIELWMRVFEYLHNTKDYARLSVTTDCQSSLAIHEDSVEAARILPAFEKHTWAQTRTLYHIDRTSRAAALKLKLCLRKLEACKAPAPAMQRADIVTRWLEQGEFPDAKPRYLATEVTNKPEVLSGHREAGMLLELLAYWKKGGGLSRPLGLGPADHIVLLERCNWNTFSMLARAQ
jgi:hypothetical protein